ncbi:MAG: hypothetical protein NT121_02350 [Chloroflexi bacterium]|nr:hypothetical protein [Chloroflexota bacterium]
MKSTIYKCLGLKGAQLSPGLHVRTRLQAGEVKYTYACDPDCHTVFLGFISDGYISNTDGVYTVTAKGQEAWQGLNAS